MLNSSQPFLNNLGNGTASTPMGRSPLMPRKTPLLWDTGSTPYGVTDSDIKGIGIPQPLIFNLNGLKLSQRGMFHPAIARLPVSGDTQYGITGTDVEDSVKPKPMIFALRGLGDRNGGVFHPLPVQAETPGQSYKIQGFTKDETDTAIGGYTVYLFNITTGIPVLTAATISDGSGLYSFTVDSTQLYWVVSYKAGTPDKTGATSNNLTGELL